MQIEANDLFMFANIVDCGSFSQAAIRLGIPKSTLSRRLATLEAQLGERLLLRSTRRLSLTDLGQLVLDHARQVQEEVNATLALSQHRQREPSGKLRISMPADFANWEMSDFLAGFIQTYPAIQIEFDLSPRRVDLIGESFDLAIRTGELSDDSSLAARLLTRFSGALYAAPAYLAKAGTPLEPEELMEHDGLLLLARNGDPLLWQLQQQQQQWQGIPPAKASANSPELLLRFAINGAGIVMLSDYFVRDALSAGKLVPVLAQWHCPPVPVSAVFPGRRLMPAKTRVFLDALQADFERRCRPWLSGKL